jgi:hypothetical protein
VLALAAACRTRAGEGGPNTLRFVESGERTDGALVDDEASLAQPFQKHEAVGGSGPSSWPFCGALMSPLNVFFSFSALLRRRPFMVWTGPDIGMAIGVVWHQ